MLIKKIKNLFKLEIFCNSAKFEDQSIGPNLSPYIPRDKINLFCDEFNKLTKNYNNDLKVSVKLILYVDNSFFFIIKGPNFSNLLKIIINTENLKLNKFNEVSIFELYDIIYLKNLFLYKKTNIKYNNILLRLQIKNSINSIKNIKILKRSYIHEQ